LGEDIEELHDMRVATRRMRAAFRVFGPYFDPITIKPHLKGLKRTGRALGPVRDLDVFEEKAQEYLATVPADQAGALDGLLEVWREKRVLARERMLVYLDGQRYTRFVRRFGSFLSRSGVGALPSPVGAPVPYQVQNVAPQLIYARNEAVRAYEPLLDSAPIELLHALRIDFKQFRYALEFFLPVLGQEARMVIKEVKAMQDHLGDLNDADVATQLLQDFLKDRPEGQEGLITYLQDRQRERARLLASFPAAWERFSRPKVGRNLALAIAAL
jgi:CHAD domain-containing protein